MRKLEQIKKDLINGDVGSLRTLLDTYEFSFDKDEYFKIVSDIVRLHQKNRSSLLRGVLLELTLNRDGIKFRNLHFEFGKAYRRYDIDYLEETMQLCKEVASFREKAFDEEYYKYKIDSIKYDISLSSDLMALKKSIKDNASSSIGREKFLMAIEYSYQLLDVEGPVEVTAEKNLASIFYSLEKYDVAKYFCSKGLKKRDLVMFHVLLANIYMKEKNYLDALKELNEVLEVQDYYDNFLLKAECYLELGSSKAALGVLYKGREVYSRRKSDKVNIFDEQIELIERTTGNDLDDKIKKEILECSQAGRVSRITEILDLLDITDDERRLLDISVARLLYKNKFVKQADTLIQKVERSKDKTELVKRKLQEAKNMKKVLKNS